MLNIEQRNRESIVRGNRIKRKVYGGRKFIFVCRWELFGEYPPNFDDGGKRRGLLKLGFLSRIEAVGSVQDWLSKGVLMAHLQEKATWTETVGAGAKDW